MTSKTSFVTQEGPANALALNKDNSQVVIAGRNVFKIFTLLEDRFEEFCNLRVGKNLNLNFSCNDVAWNLIEDHMLATAATNGAVVVWNLNRPSRSKQEHVFVDHKRTVNKVSFHMSEPMWLISGSQDGTMKCFDLRIKEATRTFYSNTESVRDVQFSPHQAHTFAAVSENGHVQLWDLRRPDKYFQHFTAHSGPIFACDWHPETTWLATASRDKTIKVWDLTAKPSCDYTINTIASVGGIKWRPQRKYHIASCALVVDFSINVWDIRRPYIPFASFNEHKDVPTGIAWRGDPQSFLSTSRDCTLYHHVFQDATRPASKANPQGIALSTKGDIAYACKASVSTPTGVEQLTNRIMRKTPVSNDTFCQASSWMHTFTAQTPNTNREPKWFKLCAENYVLSGRLNEICDHNSLVASNAGRNDVSTIWSIIKTCFENPLGNSNNNAQRRPVSEQDVVNTLNLPCIGTNNDQSTAGFENDVKSLQGETVPGIVSGGDDETETDEPPENQNFTGPFLSSYRRSLPSYKRQPKGDFSFGEGELEPLTIDYNSSGYIENMINNDNDWSLPKEAFPLRHEIQNRSPPPEQFPNHSPDLNDDSVSIMVEDQPCQLIVTSVPKPTFWDPTSLVEDALRHHANIKDIQTAACVLVALGNRRKDLNIEMALQEHWLLEYLDMLGRFKLWEVSTRIIQLAWIPSVSQLNQQSTTIHACCSSCTKPLQRSAWLCDRCHSSKHALCSICHQVVRGIYAWCQGCTHGGHVNHMSEWFNSNKQCPTGCGHMCEYI
ncbi:GATOR complex protein WDR24 isoform X2 [Nasonia vitripennis]|uniref:GATOR2 complex protein WDR24 n=1 Tax=Nasonia vitripennis TaxID=7425 RepID=A0A7M7H4G3_NASVI|nr:GATOR complex protein WDR24 isoform X2 [Nasonia vitripennis]